MRSWLLLLLLAALSATILSLGGAEGDPLPASLVDLVRNSPISSVDELKMLLQHQAGAIEEEEDDENTNPTQRRHIRSIEEAEVAQQAACKVRTEVMEVTRSMLDRRNANFMLWPPCVEVQRCSGCCNTRMLQCVPTVTSSRYLQVIKIQYVNRKAHYDKAIISVEDHVACRCQPSSSSSSLSVARSPNPPPVQPLPRSPKPPNSKADLHRHDDLKRNQRPYNSEEQESPARQWPQGSYTQLVHWTQPRVHHSYVSWSSDARVEHGVVGSPPPVGPGSGHDVSREEIGGDGRRQQSHGHRSSEDLRTQYWLDAPQSDSASPPGDPTPSPPTPSPSSFPVSTNLSDSASSQPRVEATPTHAQTLTERRTGSRSEESGEPANEGEAKDFRLVNGGGHMTEEERRQKVLEVVQGELDRPHPPQQSPKPVISTAAPPSSRHTPFRPASPRVRRRRKHRKRISKAAMRTMIM
ncbi:platelet-derived growth factor beta polypeptide a [Nerophis lumbriciformis]|uniref:platelet-derived growth factor beta polypeptide a n=1 Tax=Nerophis lumbriciformis TaxID=546530 RepID=UPI002ADF9B25|nr:platelet-derived growth factor beta polypeptide a [Nerophis lumbriciformis]